MLMSVGSLNSIIPLVIQLTRNVRSALQIFLDTVENLKSSSKLLSSQRFQISQDKIKLVNLYVFVSKYVICDTVHEKLSYFRREGVANFSHYIQMLMVSWSAHLIILLYGYSNTEWYALSHISVFQTAS